MDDKSKNLDQSTHSGKALRTLSLAAFVGALVIVLYPISSPMKAYFSIMGVGLLIAGAALLMGGVLGFLFGIPRTLQRESNSSESTEDASKVDYLANTNLEQISDWLTKMIVGVGLTQLTVMPAFLVKVSKYLAKGLGDNASDPVFVLSLLLYFSAVGFLFGYLWTRLNLARALRQADLKSIGVLADRVEQTNRKVEEFKRQSEIDAYALNLIYSWFNPGRDVPEVSDDELRDVITAASSPTRAQIFNQAWKIRADNWKKDKPLMERSIPVFRALITADTEGQYHANHGQLGFALKDQLKPDWSDAESELSTAIEIRGPWQDAGWIFYEFNRAICQIMLDKAFQQDQPSEQSVRKQILEDLRIAWNSDLRKIIQEEELFNRWIKMNKVKNSELAV